jgi:hypothetical protein
MFGWEPLKIRRVTFVLDDEAVLKDARRLCLKASKFLPDSTAEAAAMMRTAYENIQHIHKDTPTRRLCLAMIKFTNPGLQIESVQREPQNDQNC